MGFAGGSDTTQNDRWPFLMAEAGNPVTLPTATCAGFCPGAWLPPWLLQIAVGFANASSWIVTFSLPSPANAPHTVAVSARPLLVDVTGCEFLKWILAAKTTPAVILSTIPVINS